MAYTNLRFMPHWFAEALRDERGIDDLRTFAERTGISASTLSRLENLQTPDLSTFLRLCGYLERSPMDFVKDVAVHADSALCAPCMPKGTKPSFLK